MAKGGTFQGHATHAANEFSMMLTTVYAVC